MNVWVRRRRNVCMFFISTLLSLFSVLRLKQKKVVAWELFYCVLHFLFFLYNILVFFFHLRIENKNQFRDTLLHKTLCSNPLFWSSILINVSVRVCGLHSCVVCRELGWRHLVSLHHLEHQGIPGEGVQTEERTAAAPEGCTSLNTDSAFALAALIHAQVKVRGSCHLLSLQMLSLRALQGI